MIGYPEIEEQWLLGNDTPMSAQQWETAFCWCAEKFGREWLQPTHPGRLVTDSYVVAAAWDAGSRAEPLRGADRLIRKLGTNISDVDWAVLAELCAAAHFASRGARVVFEQDIHLEASGRKPDMHVQFPVGSFHVEVTCPEMGREYLRLMGLLRSTVESITIDNRHAQVYFYREPTPMEGATVRQFLHTGDEPLFRRHVDGVAEIFLDQPTDESLSTFPPAVNEPGPLLAATSFRLSAGVLARRTTVKLPFSDTRASMFIKGEAQQLPKGGPGVIILDVSRPVGKLEFWADAVRAYLSGTTAHTRVSAVLIWKAGYTATGVELRKELILNPRAASPLSADTERVIAAFGDDWPYRLMPQ
ncbi:MAG: hypothetical protein E6I91_08310 [Chloroflexi bacterium]|nr:MAG: hypothetical protein E6I91_08310 [Chloroflexota bacterium]